ncbi:hypothetical protein TNCV_3177351 [Trichonephila clavipes]|nr:hypothetical protein TNCV_3177351 [Trichonephila clavipes]
MDVCKCIVPSRHGGTLNCRRAASPLERLVEGKERWLQITNKKVTLHGYSDASEAAYACVVYAVQRDRKTTKVVMLGRYLLVALQKSEKNMG